MSKYKFKYTEKNLGRGSEFETRALLFLIGISPKKHLIHYIFIDCFNDLTGSGEKCDTLFDIQSKGVANMTPRKIGASLVTLFENSLSQLSFSSFSIFIPPAGVEYIVDSTLRTYQIDNFGSAKTKVIDGLKSEYIRRNPDLTADQDLDNSICSFVNKVVFVCDRGSKADYIKPLTSFKSKDVKDDNFFDAIFDEIQKSQLAKKTVNIELQQISAISEALLFEKHLKTQDINILVVNRLIGIDVFKRRAIPVAFLDEVRNLDSDSAKDLIIDCNSKLSKALFDKNSKLEFWSFLECALAKTYENPDYSSSDVYSLIEAEHGVLSRHMQGVAGVYLISLIKEGLAN